MTVLHPPSQTRDELAPPVTPVQSEVAGALGRLGQGWQVLVRPRLGLEQPDFVAVHPAFGICAILVEDWSSGTHRKAQDGSVEFREIDGTARRVAHPRFEAARCRATIYDRYFAQPGDPAEPTDAVRAVVVVPRCTTAAAHEVLAHPAAASAELAVDVWGGDALHRQVGDIVGGGIDIQPDPSSLDRFFAHVVEPGRPSCAPPPPLDLTDAQRDVAENRSGRRMRRVHGPAGSGKSVALAARAARLAAEGQRVLLLSFNVTMANHLRQLSTAFSHQYGADPTMVTCANFHSFCEQVVDDAGQFGLEVRRPYGMRFADSIVAMALHVYGAGFERSYDGILVDEGQDYTLAWWNLLRGHALAPDGEMLLAADPQQDLYGRSPWYDDEHARAAGLDDPWIELTGSRRMAPDLTRVAATFADTHVFGGAARGTFPVHSSDNGADSAGAPQPTTTGRWLNINGVSGLGREIGGEVVRLLRDQPDLSPRDIVFLCEYHHDGEAAVAEIEAAGYPVHHLFSRDPDNPRRGRRYRLGPDADAVKGCTVHSFKGWTTRALVMGIGVETRSKGAAYVSMTRVGADPAGSPSFISIVNADHRLADFGSTFAATLTPSTVAVNAWDPPRPDQRVG